MLRILIKEYLLYYKILDTTHEKREQPEHTSCWSSRSTDINRRDRRLVFEDISTIQNDRTRPRWGAKNLQQSHDQITRCECHTEKKNTNIGG